MKLNNSLKNHMALTLNRRIKIQQERGHNIPQKKIDNFLFWLDQVKQANRVEPVSDKLKPFNLQTEIIEAQLPWGEDISSKTSTEESQE